MRMNKRRKKWRRYNKKWIANRAPSERKNPKIKGTIAK